MGSVFVDTPFLYALEDLSDQNHGYAKKIWKKALKNPPRLVLTSYIFDETVTLLQATLNHAKAFEVGNRLLESALVDFIHVTPELFLSAWAYFTKHRDKGYSFTDCTSFVVMGDRDLKVAFSFDKHFRQAGFKIAAPSAIS
jgi:predicted nucleic acid-binding protein